ncbi:MAG: hypothetical protein KGD58_00320 [Candidatus Lokiarchaeota archaeon]|nr:hypothetical protein [Candidatus Lokiarchaeota archaeon]
MPVLEINELIVLIIISIPVAFSPYLLKKRRDIMKWFPAYYALFITFLSTNLEAFYAPDTFNFMEHFFAMVAGVLMCVAAGYEYYGKILKGKQLKVSHKSRGMVEK